MTEAVTEITSKVAKDVYEETFRRCMQVVEQNIVPDALVRRGIRYLLSQRVKEVGRKALLTVHGNAPHNPAPSLGCVPVPW